MVFRQYEFAYEPFCLLFVWIFYYKFHIEKVFRRYELFYEFRNLIEIEKI